MPTSSEREFSYPEPNLIVSRDGFSVEVHPQSHSIRYTDAGAVAEIFAEVLVSPEPKMAIRRKDVLVSSAEDSERDRIIHNIARAFAFKGWILVVE